MWRTAARSRGGASSRRWCSPILPRDGRECAPLLFREQTLVSAVLTGLRELLPFDLLGFDTDNDSVFMNETVRDYCRDGGIVFTRCRPWRKNDQAFVEQKNGAVVRHMVGYRRLEGPEAVAALSQLYATARLFVNFFQPSFKLAGKTRDGTRVTDPFRPRFRRGPARPGRGTRSGNAQDTPGNGVADRGLEGIEGDRPCVATAESGAHQRLGPDRFVISPV